MPTPSELTLAPPVVWSRIDAKALRDVMASTTSSLHELLLQFARDEVETYLAEQWQIEAWAVMQEYHDALTGSARDQWETYMRHSQRENDLLELVNWMKTHPIAV